MIGATVLPFALGQDIAGYIMSAVTVGCSACGLFFCPLQVEMTDDAYILYFALRTKVIPLKGMISVEPFSFKDGMIVRICGSGGFYGYWGWFYNRKAGRFFAYCTNPTDCIFLRFPNRAYALPAIH